MQNYQPYPEQIPPAKPTGRTAVKTAGLLLALILAGLILCHVTVLKVRTITVVGNVHVTQSEIVALAGLNKPVSILNIREKNVQEGIDSHIRLTYERMEYRGIHEVVLFVKEQVPCAVLNLSEGQYLLDNTGLVLEKRETPRYDEGYLMLSGMNVKRITVGEKLLPVHQQQLTAYCIVMDEMHAQNCFYEFSELNLVRTDNLYLVSVDGYIVNLGDATEMRAKLFTVRGVLSELRKMGKEPGALDATAPGYATYTPPDI